MGHKMLAIKAMCLVLVTEQQAVLVAAALSGSSMTSRMSWEKAHSARQTERGAARCEPGTQQRGWQEMLFDDVAPSEMETVEHF